MNEYWAEFDARLARLVALRDELKSELVALEQIPDVANAYSGRYYLGNLADSGPIQLSESAAPCAHEQQRHHRQRNAALRKAAGANSQARRQEVHLRSIRPEQRHASRCTAVE